MSLEKDVKKHVKRLLKIAYPWLEYTKIKRYDDFEDDLDVSKAMLKLLKHPVQRVFGVEVRKKELGKCYDVDDLIELIVEKMSQQQQAEEEQIKRTSPLFLLFACLGKLAASDGRLNTREDEYLGRCMENNFELQPSSRAVLRKHWREQANDQAESFAILLRDFAMHQEVGEQAKHAAAHWCFELALADRPINAKEEQLLRLALATLCPQVRYDEFRAENYPDPAQYYNVLGCDPSDSDETIRTAYRKLMSELHPDKLQSKGVGDEIMEYAKRRSQEITSAYDMIRKLRK